MKRPWVPWLLYGICLAVALPALAWLSLAALRLERAEQSARQTAKQEEKLRLATWRLDTMLMPIVAAEAARTYDDYARLRREGGPQSGAMPRRSQFVLAYFEIPPGGQFAPPPVRADSPASNQPPRIDYAGLTARLPSEMLAPGDPASEANVAALDRGVKWSWPQSTIQVIQPPLDDDFLRRQQSNAINTAREFVQQRTAKAPPAQAANVQEGVSRPVWIDGELVVARRVVVDGRELVQGCWLDWPKLARQMKTEVADLVPSVELVPVENERGVNYAHALATLPLQLVAPTPAAEGGWTPLAIGLTVAWAGVILGAVAAAALLAGVVALSRRREAFVSAVTHELRTPLTTFRMYAEMLDEGMVDDDAKRAGYLRTLRSEADRLWHLVENVLAYARLERGRTSAGRQRVTPAELWERIGPRLAERAQRSGTHVELTMENGAASTILATDPVAVEQILFNLVDNACKYGSDGPSRAIQLEASTRDGLVEFRVRDHGAGIDAAQTGKLFRPFSKSAVQAAQSAPGVGLGLALARRLARQLGGDLRFEPTLGGGATFLLTLPATAAQAD
jgi:signal transduction histidine kinase